MQNASAREESLARWRENARADRIINETDTRWIAKVVPVGPSNASINVVQAIKPLVCVAKAGRSKVKRG